jgi:hypothetical protein
MDQHPDAGDKEQPNAGERIEQETGIGLERRLRAVVSRVGQVPGIGTEPGVKNRLIGLVVVFACRRPGRVLPDRSASHRESQYDHANTNSADCPLLKLTAKEEHDGRAEGRQQRNQPDVG